MKSQPLSVLFAGRTVLARLVNGTEIVIAVRALPQRFLIRVIECAEFNHALVELCCYLRAEDTGKPNIQPTDAPAAWPDVPAPDGLVPLAQGFCDNLEDASVVKLYETAKELNFQRAADWAKGRIAAQQLVAPFHQAALQQVLPLVENVLQPLLKKLDALSTSTPSAPSSSVAAAKAS